MKRNLVICAVLAFALTLAACGGGGVNQANYDKIENGMTLEQVKDILGEPADGGGIGGLSAGGYTWKDGDKSINITFANDKVAVKTKSGF